MTLEYPTLEDLEALLKEVSEVSESIYHNKNHLIRALQNRIAEKHLEEYQDAELLQQLRQFDLKQLDAWLYAFQQTETYPPKELIQAKTEKENDRSNLYMWELIQEAGRSPASESSSASARHPTKPPTDPSDPTKE